MYLFNVERSDKLTNNRSNSRQTCSVGYSERVKLYKCGWKGHVVGIKDESWT